MRHFVRWLRGGGVRDGISHGVSDEIGYQTAQGISTQYAATAFHGADTEGALLENPSPGSAVSRVSAAGRPLPQSAGKSGERGHYCSGNSRMAAR